MLTVLSKMIFIAVASAAEALAVALTQNVRTRWSLWWTLYAFTFVCWPCIQVAFTEASCRNRLELLKLYCLSVVIMTPWINVRILKDCLPVNPSLHSQPPHFRVPLLEQVAASDFPVQSHSSHLNSNAICSPVPNSSIRVCPGPLLFIAEHFSFVAPKLA